MRAESPGPRFLKLKDVATYLNVGESQVYTLVRSGALPAVKIGGRGFWRVDRERLDRYLEDLHADMGAALDRLQAREECRRPLADGAEVMTTAQAATTIGVTRQNVNHLVKKGKVRARKVGGKLYVSEDDVRAYRDLRRLPLPSAR